MENIRRHTGAGIISNDMTRVQLPALKDFIVFSYAKEIITELH